MNWRGWMRVGMLGLCLALLLATGACQTRQAEILTVEERAWLDQHPSIRIAPDPNFPPIEYFDEQGNYRGLVADYFALIEQNLNYRFEIVHLGTWEDVIKQARSHQIDGITAAQITPERSEYLLYSQSIIDIPNVIIMRDDKPGTFTFAQMDGMTLVVTSGNALHEYVETRYPEIRVQPVADDLTALTEVSFGRADATVVNLAIASYLIEQSGITNLRVVGDSGKTNSLAIATRKDWPMLNGILIKGLSAVTQEQREQINRRWLRLENTSWLPQREILIAAGVAGVVILVVLMLILTWNWTLQKQVAHKTAELQRELIEREKANEKIESQMQRISALRAVDLLINASVDLRMVLNTLLEQVASQLKADATDILLWNPQIEVLEFAEGLGFRGRGARNVQLRSGSGLAGNVAQTRRLLQVPSMREQPDIYRVEEFASEQFVSYYGVPLLANNQVKGVLEIFMRTPFYPDQEWLDFLETLAGQAAIALDKAELFENLQQSNQELYHAYEETIEGWANALDLRDQETENHSRRVMEMSVELARAIGMSPEEVAHVRRGAWLHDIGKMGIPDQVLLKNGPLTPDEWQIMRQHPLFAYNLLSSITFLKPALEIPYCHHEKWDGSGYPRGLKGEQIPLSARIFAVVDVWDALRNDRPYRQAWSEDQVRAYLRQQAGRHFDPRVVETFLQLLHTTREL